MIGRHAQRAQRIRRHRGIAPLLVVLACARPSRGEPRRGKAASSPPAHLPPSRPPGRQAMARAGQSLLAVTLFDGLPGAPAAAAIGKIPGAIVHRWEIVAGNAELAVTINTADVPRLAAMSDVQFIEEAPEITLRNNTDRWIVQSNVPNVTPVYDHGIHGEGQVVGILD